MWVRLATAVPMGRVAGPDIWHAPGHPAASTPRLQFCVTGPRPPRPSSSQQATCREELEFMAYRLTADAEEPSDAGLAAAAAAAYGGGAGGAGWGGAAAFGNGGGGYAHFGGGKKKGKRPRNFR